MSPHEFDEGAYHVKLYPPVQAENEAKLSSLPTLDEIVAATRPAAAITPTPYILIGSENPIQACLLQLDFKKDDFDRRDYMTTGPADMESRVDPSLTLVFDIINRFLLTARTLVRASYIKPLKPQKTIWHLQYLNDSEEELPHVDGLVRRRANAQFKFEFTQCDLPVWSRATELMNSYSPHTWESILLDAEALLPDIGAALAMAYTALETFIAWCLTELPLRGIAPDLWKWINNRRHWTQNPSVSDQYDTLLKALTTKSLKQDAPQLWEAFQHLRDIRNSFAHKGIPRLKGNPVTLEQATTLVAQTKEIIAWAEALLPNALHRPRF